MTTHKRGRPAGSTRSPAADSLAISSPLSISASMTFQDALRGFLEAQKPLSALQLADAGYAQKEHTADAATAQLIRTIDAFIERRKSVGARAENALTTPQSLSRRDRLRHPPELSEARQAEVSKVLLARVQELIGKREADASTFLLPTTQNDMLWLWAVAAQIFFQTRRKALVNEAFSEVELTRVLSADPRTEGGRALRRCHDLLVKMIVKGAKKNGLL